MTVVVPCDAVEAEKATIQAASIKGPVYLRLGREIFPIISSEALDFKIGKASKIKEGKDLTIIACGSMVYNSIKALEILEKDNIDAAILNLHTVKPIDKKAIIGAARDTGAIVTAEEHQLAGGMGSAVSEVLSQEMPVPIEMVGVDDRFGESGSPWEVMKHLNLMPEDIALAAKKLLKRKNSS